MNSLSMGSYPLSYTWNFVGPEFPTLFFIHGMTMDSSQWTLLLKNLPAHVNTLTYDAYGHGQTGISADPITMTLLTDEAVALIRHLNLDQVHLVGCGMGGNIAFELAKREPLHALSLTMLSSIFLLQKNTLGKRLDFLSQLMDIDRDLAAQKWLTDSLSTLTDEKAILFSHAFRKISARIIKEQYDALQHCYDPVRFNLIDELGHISVPTLILHGNDDAFLPPQLAAILSACIPYSHWQIIPDAAQQIPLDQPRLTADLLMRFISGTKAPMPSFPVYRELIEKYLKILRSALEKSLPDAHMLRINVLREMTVLWNGEPINGKWNQRGAKELLLYLVLHHGAAGRDELIEAFLPDLPEERARNNLRVRINHLNQIFHQSENPDVREILLVGESTLALNAELKSDVGDYLKRLRAFTDLHLTLNEQAIVFIDLLRQYDPANFSSFRSDWIFSLTEEIESYLADALEELIPKLRAQNMFGPAREILQSASYVEPYDGFCDEQLAEMHQSGVL
jgi:Predicted hydrolases or acyltransferases (alpha/beta hydrolase superfamily)